MAEAELRIKPRVVGSGSSLRPVERDLRRLERTQARTFQNGERWVRRFGAALSRVGNRVTRTGASLERLSAAFDVIQRVSSVITRGGRSVFDAVIGPNVELERAQTTFNTLVGDTRKAAKLIEDIRENAARTPFEFGELLEGSRRLLRLTGANVEQNKALLVLSEQLAAINPTKSVTDAAEALLDAQVGEFERLKEFGIKLRKEEVDKAAKAGKLAGGEFGDKYLDSIAKAVAKQTGGRDIVGALSQTFSGRVSTLRDIGTELGREIGGPAFEILSRGLGELIGNLERMSVSPEFRRDIDDLKDFAKDAAKWAVELARNLPQGVRQLRELITSTRTFVSENETLLKVLAGGAVANKLTGGAVGRGAGFLASSAGSLGMRALFGKRGGGAAGELSDIAAQPVRVVNFGELTGTGSLFSQAAGKSVASSGAAAGIGGKGGGLVGALSAGGFSGVSTGALAAGGVGAGIAAVTALLFAFGKIAQKTDNAANAIDRMIAADKARRKASADLTAEEKKRAVAENNLRESTRELYAAVAAQDVKGIAREATQLYRLRGAEGLKAANEVTKSLGIQFKAGKGGRLVGVTGKDALAMRPEMAAEYNALVDKANRFKTQDPTGRLWRAELGTADGQQRDRDAFRFADMIEGSNKVQKELAQALKTVTGLRKRPAHFSGDINIILGSDLVANPRAFAREFQTQLFEDVDSRE